MGREEAENRKNWFEKSAGEKKGGGKEGIETGEIKKEGCREEEASIEEKLSGLKCR